MPDANDPGAPDRMPLWLFAGMFLASPALMAIAVLLARYRHRLQLDHSHLATPLVIAHLTAVVAFVLIWRWRRRQAG